MINTILFSIQSFWGAVFILPQSVLKEVDKICRTYLWGGSEDKRKVALVSWEQVCFPKNQGGLSIKGSSNWNVASVGQLIWQLTVNKESLWVKWVHGIYIKEDISIWQHIAPVDSSWYWRKLTSLKAQMHQWYIQDRYQLTKYGEYSITSSYLAIIGQRPKLNNAELVWTSMALPRHRFLVWLAVHGRLLTQERKVRLHIQDDETDCCLCDEQVMETNSHLFEHCRWTKEVWLEIQKWTGVSVSAGGIQQVLENIKKKHWRKFQKEVKQLAMELCFIILGVLGIGRNLEISMYIL